MALIDRLLRDVGVNISKEMSKLSQSVEDFFLQDHITKLCPDKKRTTTDLTTGKTIQLRFRMGTLNSLHQQFVSVSESDCSFSSFCRYVPSFVRKPKYNEWGTCLCICCANPQLKVDKLCHLKVIPYTDLETIDYEDLPDLIDQLKALKKYPHAHKTMLLTMPYLFCQ